MKLTIKQLKQLIKEQVEEVTAAEMESSFEPDSFRPSRPTSGPQAEQLAAYRRKEAIHEAVKKIVDKYSVSEIRDELDKMDDIRADANPNL